MPEAYCLRRFYWQLFATLTFLKPGTTRASSLPLVFVWLRYTAQAEGIHFRRLIWVLRFEFGPRGGRGHYHLCLAGLPPASMCQRLCRTLESAWQIRSNALAEVTLYDQARDGLGYILKLPHFKHASLRRNSLGSDGDDCEPMLSASLIQAVRRGRM